MARRPRTDFEGAVHHVINRGTARTSLYRCDADRRDFIAGLSSIGARFGVEVHGLVLMANHYHLMLRSDDARLSEAMRWLDGRYAQRFNLRHDRVGALYQGRFTSRLIDSDAYLETVAHYIHLNPVDAGLATDPVAYRWSSLPSYAGAKRVPPWLHTELVLAGRSGPEFVAAMANAATHHQMGDRHPSPPLAPIDDLAESRLRELERLIALTLDTSVDDIHQPATGNENLARLVCLARCSDIPDITPAQLADRYGLRDPSALRQARRRLRRKMATSARLAAAVRTLDAQETCHA